MSTSTTNYGLVKPDVNNPDDSDLWGGMLNADMDELDTLLQAGINSPVSAEAASFSVTAPTTGTSAIGSSNAFFTCDATSGAIVASLPASASAGSGFRVAFKKMDSSANTVTITASGSDKIDGLGTFVLSTQYVWVVIICDGTKWNIVSSTSSKNTFVSVKVQTFSTTGTYTPSAGMIYCIVEMVGGGGGGGGNNGNTATGGGGAGGYLRAVLTSAQIGSSQTVAIGAAGSAGSNSSGGSGGTTSLGSLLSCTGGSGGAAATVNTGNAGGSGGTATVSTGTALVSYSGQQGGYGSGDFLYVGGYGGSSPLGFGGSMLVAQNGTSLNGNAGVGYGAGGSGATQSSTGGAGTAGYVAITEYCSQ